MRRLRDAILGIFRDLLPRDEDSCRLVCANQARHRGLPLPAGLIHPVAGLFIPAGDHVIMVAVDRSGGISHLVRCWHFLEQTGEGWDLRISLFYVFLSPTRHANETQRALWDFLEKKASSDLGGLLQVHFITCERPRDLDCHAEILPSIVQHCREQLEEQGILGVFRALLATDLAKPRNLVPSPKNIASP